MSGGPSASGLLLPPTPADRLATSAAPRRWTLRWMVGAARYAFIRIRTRLLLEARVGAFSRVRSAIPVRYRFGGAEDLERLSAIDPKYDEPAKRKARQRLAHGDRLVLGEYDGQAIFSGWVMFGAIDTGARRPWPMSPTRAYSYKLHTVESYRGQRVAAGFYQFIEPALAARGCTRLVCWVSDRNVASVRAHARAGFATCAQIYEIRLFGFWTTHWRSIGLQRYLRSATP